MTLCLIGFFQRVAPAVMTSEPMGAFEISASGLGGLSASYCYSYVVLLIPTGVLADSWGPRKRLTAGGMVAAAGTILFSLAPDFFWANTGRALIGGSVGVGYVVLLKLSSRWLPPRFYTLAAGLALFFGVLGAVTAGVPLRLLIDTIGWRPSLLASGLITLAGAVVSDDLQAKGYRSYAPPQAPDSQPARSPGAIGGVVNTGMTIGTPILQSVIGWILDLTWKGNWIQGARVYEAASFKLGFTVMLAWSLLSCLIVSFTRETHCRPAS